MDFFELHSHDSRRRGLGVVNKDSGTVACIAASQSVGITSIPW